MQMDNMAENAAQGAEQGGQVVDGVVVGMRDIASKIDIVEDIAYETNLLALK